MQNLLLITTSLLLLFTNSYYSSYGVLIFAGFCFLSSIINKSTLNITQISLSVLLVLSYIFSGIKGLSLEPTILLILLVSNISSFNTDKKTIHKLAKWLTIIFSILAIGQVFISQFAYGSFINIFNTKEIYPNAFAAINLLFLPLNTKKYQSLNILNILLSKSRIGLLVSGIYLFYKYIIEKKRSKAILISSIILLIIPFSLITKTNQSVEFNSIDQRIEHWKNSPKLLNNIKSILVGYGANSFSYIYPRVQNVPENQAPHSHNLLINFAIEYGVLFTFIFILYVIKHTISLDKEYKIALSLFFIHNLVDLNIQFPLTIFIILVIINSQRKLAQNKNIMLIATNSTLLLVLILSLTNNFIYSHKDNLLLQNSSDLVKIYLDQNPLDSKQLLKIDESKYIKDVFKDNPYDIDNLVLLYKHYPNVELNEEWLSNYKKWYILHSKYNLNYIHEKKTIDKLKEVYKNRDPEFVENL